jgi:aldehyde:ferredoxin oxidoreductase
MIKDYYRVRGWEDDGRIQKKKLAVLGLKEVSPDA